MTVCWGKGKFWILFLEVQLRTELNDEMNQIERLHSMKINELKHEHRKSLEMMKWKYSNHEGDLVELQATKEKLDVSELGEFRVQCYYKN